MLRWKKNKRRFRPTNRAPFFGRFLRRRIGIEQLCDECSKPYLDRPDAKPVEHLVFGSAVALVFEEHRYGKRHFHVQIGRYSPHGNRMCVSTLLTEDNIKDVAEVAILAQRFIREQKTLRLVSRR